MIRPIPTIYRFFPRDVILARYILWPCVHVCLSICLSQVGVLLKRLNKGSRKQHLTIAQGWNGARQTHCYYTPLIGSIAYIFVPFPMTLDDPEGHSPNAGLIKCNSTNICATFRTVLTDTARRAVSRRFLSINTKRLTIVGSTMSADVT